MINIVLASVVVIVVITLAILLYNSMLLISELNKRLLYIITDILGTINLETPHLDLLNNNPIDIPMPEVFEEDDEYFNPHEIDVTTNE